MKARIPRPWPRGVAHLHLLRCLLLLTFPTTLILTPLAFAEAPATGVIEGRVQNKTNGNYLNNVRILLRGTNREVFTAEGGFFRITQLPAGPVTLEVTYAGLTREEVVVVVRPGLTATAEIGLSHHAEGEVNPIELSEFVVQSKRETNAAAIAVNEQRNSFSQKSVVAADQFGTLPDSNPGELMKWLPGVSVEYFANNITGVSVRGLDSAATDIRFDGMPMASASSTATDRGFEMLGATASDIARVEIRKLRTPEDSAFALGGSINLIRRSAFEASKPRLTYNIFETTDFEDFTIKKRPSARDQYQQGWRPNVRLTWTHPVTKNFGYALTVGHDDVLSRVHWSTPTFNWGTAAQATAAEAFMAAGQPLTTVSVYNPARQTDLLHDNAKRDVKDYFTAKLDWKPSTELKLSYSFNATRYLEISGDDLRFTWNTGAAVRNDQYSTYGTAGAGLINYDLREGWRNGIKPVLTHVVDGEWKHNDWTVKAAGSFSQSRHQYRDTADGFFNSTMLNGSSIPLSGIGTGRANPRKITVNLLDQDYSFSRRVEAFDATTGQAVDWQNPDNLYIGGAVSRPSRTIESIAAIDLSVRRDFNFKNPVAIKMGYEYTDQFRNVQQYDSNMWTFVGADGIAGTFDDRSTLISNQNVLPSRDSYYNAPAVPRMNFARLYQLYQQHPTWFAYRDAESYRFSVRDPYELSEKTHAGYLEFTGTLLSNRLSYIFGVRYERTDAWGLGLLDNGASSVPATVPANSLQAAQLRYVRKGARGEGSNDGYFPSAEIAYNLTDNLIFRLGYAKTQAKNRYQRSVIPSSTIDYTPPTSGPFADVALGSINLRNPNLKPWTADNYETHLEYYTPQGGVLSAGVYRKAISDNQVSKSVLLNTPALVESFNLEPSFLNFQATSWLNEGNLQLDGAEFDVRQPLDVVLPAFARGFILTGGFTYNNISKFDYPNGNVAVDFQNYYQTQTKVSLGYSRGRVSTHLGVIQYGKVYRQRDDAAGHVGDRYYPAYITADFSVEIRVTRWANLFISGRNVNDAHKTRIRAIDGAPEWSQLQAENNLGVTYTVGVSGTY